MFPQLFFLLSCHQSYMHDQTRISFGALQVSSWFHCQTTPSLCPSYICHRSNICQRFFTLYSCSPNSYGAQYVFFLFQPLEDIQLQNACGRTSLL